MALVNISEHNSFGLIKVRSRMIMDPNSCVNTTLIYTSFLPTPNISIIMKLKTSGSKTSIVYEKI